jgi:hypothetical protein
VSSAQLEKAAAKTGDKAVETAADVRREAPDMTRSNVVAATAAPCPG